jgi:hypothetical protein
MLIKNNPVNAVVDVRKEWQQRICLFKRGLINKKKIDK